MDGTVQEKEWVFSRFMRASFFLSIVALLVVGCGPSAEEKYANCVMEEVDPLQLQLDRSNLFLSRISSGGEGVGSKTGYLTFDNFAYEYLKITYKNFADSQEVASLRAAYEEQFGEPVPYNKSEPYLVWRILVSRKLVPELERQIENEEFNCGAGYKY